MKKKLLSWILALAMAVSLLPAPAFAAQENTEEIPRTLAEEAAKDEEKDDEEKDDTEDETPSLLKRPSVSAKHPVHLSEGTVSFSDVIAEDAGLMSFSKGEVKVTKGDVKVIDWSVGNTKSLKFTLSGGKEGDTITFPVIIQSQKYGQATLTVTVTLGYEKIMITSANTVVLGSSLKLTCAGQNGTAAVIYSITSGSDVATLNGDVLTPKKGGKVTVTVTQVAGEGQEAQVSDPFEITVTKATPYGTPTFTKLTHAGQTLSDVSLKADYFSVKGRVEWVLSSDTVAVANTAYEWKFIPEDTDSYNTITGTVVPYTVSDSTFIAGEDSSTTENDDGSFTTISHGKDDARYELTEYADGSVRMIHTTIDGTVTTTERDADGYRTQTIENADGSRQITSTDKSGISYTTITNQYGYTDVQVYLPSSILKTAAKTGDTISLPIPEIPRTDDRADAPVITFSLSTSTPVRISIPINSPTAGTVAIIIDKDGTESVVKTSTIARDAIEVTLTGSTTVKVADVSKRFLDVEQRSWYTGAVDFATSRGLFSGISATRFAPTETMSRAMLVTVLHNLEDNPYYAYTSRFSDLANTWYEEAAAWAAANGYINGFEDGTFRGDSPITREQLAVILYRYAGYPSVKEYVNQSLANFLDHDSISPYAYEAMYWAVCSGVLYTSGSNKLSPQGNATRAEVAVAFQNLVDFMNH